jgi:poly(3-hydroxybutyrate) depolymerase
MAAFVLALTLSGAGLAAANTPPTVSVDPLQRVFYPASASTMLTGTGTDAEGAVTYLWKQTDGPAGAMIASPTGAQTQVTSLVPGLYTFTLTVTDSNNVSRSAATQVTVLEKRTFTIETVTREVYVHPPPAGSGPAPVLLVYHGHSGTAAGFSQKGFELAWPEAIVVYLQGLPTLSPGDPQCMNSGWQHAKGEVNCANGVVDQDLKLTDTVLDWLDQHYTVDHARQFAHGWSNGGEFLYDVLWSERGDRFAAVVPASAILNTTTGKLPRSVMSIAGHSDPVVPFAQQRSSSEAVRTLDQCVTQGDATWATGASGLIGTRYSSAIDKPVVFLEYDGGHAYPDAVPALIVKFLKDAPPLAVVAGDGGVPLDLAGGATPDMGGVEPTTSPGDGGVPTAQDGAASDPTVAAGDHGCTMAPGARADQAGNLALLALGLVSILVARCRARARPRA